VNALCSFLGWAEKGSFRKNESVNKCSKIWKIYYLKLTIRKKQEHENDKTIFLA
jgi:hypothetical protein